MHISITKHFILALFLVLIPALKASAQNDCPIAPDSETGDDAQLFDELETNENLVKNLTERLGINTLANGRECQETGWGFCPPDNGPASLCDGFTGSFSDCLEDGAAYRRILNAAMLIQRTRGFWFSLADKVNATAYNPTCGDSADGFAPDDDHNKITITGRPIRSRGALYRANVLIHEAKHINSRAHVGGCQAQGPNFGQGQCDQVYREDNGNGKIWGSYGTGVAFLHDAIYSFRQDFNHHQLNIARHIANGYIDRRFQFHPGFKLSCYGACEENGSTIIEWNSLGSLSHTDGLNSGSELAAYNEVAYFPDPDDLFHHGRMPSGAPLVKFGLSAGDDEINTLGTFPIPPFNPLAPFLKNHLLLLTIETKRLQPLDLASKAKELAFSNKFKVPQKVDLPPTTYEFANNLSDIQRDIGIFAGHLHPNREIAVSDSDCTGICVITGYSMSVKENRVSKLGIKVQEMDPKGMLKGFSFFADTDGNKTRASFEDAETVVELSRQGHAEDSFITGIAATIKNKPGDKINRTNYMVWYMPWTRHAGRHNAVPDHDTYLYCEESEHISGVAIVPGQDREQNNTIRFGFYCHTPSGISGMIHSPVRNQVLATEFADGNVWHEAQKLSFASFVSAGRQPREARCPASHPMLTGINILEKEGRIVGVSGVQCRSIEDFSRPVLFSHDLRPIAWNGKSKLIACPGFSHATGIRFTGRDTLTGLSLRCSNNGHWLANDQKVDESTVAQTGR